jgi:hypothetical protein
MTTTSSPAGQFTPASQVAKAIQRTHESLKSASVAAIALKQGLLATPIDDPWTAMPQENRLFDVLQESANALGGVSAAFETLRYTTTKSYPGVDMVLIGTSVAVESAREAALEAVRYRALKDVPGITSAMQDVEFALTVGTANAREAAAHLGIALPA